MSNEEQKQRTVGEVLLSIEEKIIGIGKSFSVIDQSNKLILNKLNELSLSSIKREVAPARVEPEVREKTERYVPPEKSLEVSDTPRPNTRRQVDVSPERISPSMKDPQVSKIPVQQRVVDQNGKDVFMADVVIKDRDTSDVMHKTRSNANGRWQAYLPTGSYLIKISKTNNETKEKMEFFQEFEVKSEKKSLELEEFKINK